MSTAAGHRARRRNGGGIPVRESSYPQSPHREDTKNRVSPNPSANPLVKPLPHPKAPGKNAKNASPAPRFAGPAPTSTTCNPDASGQYPEGRVRKMIPVTVCAGCGPEVLSALPLIQHRCDKVNTLVGGSDGFFCHSVI